MFTGVLKQMYFTFLVCMPVMNLQILFQFSDNIVFGILRVRQHHIVDLRRVVTHCLCKVY